MSDANLYLFDDRRARRWAPMTLTRPVGELLFGCMTLRERAERVFGARCVGHLTRRALVGFDEPGAAPAIEPVNVPSDRPRILLSSRAVVEFPTVEVPEGPADLFVNDQPVGWIIPAGGPMVIEAWLRDPSAAPASPLRVDLDGRILDRPWNLVAMNGDRVARDVADLWSGRDPDTDHDSPSEPETPPGVHRIGDHPISLAEGATIEPGVFVDVREGPVRLDAGARVEGPARLVGPLFVGRNSTVLGGTVGSSSIGPVCLVRGELAHSILLGFVNKAHDGHIGHALVGRWVNLGAFTTNSDLKNNYRTVRVWTPEGEVDTGLIKVGCFLGDHVKTGIGTVINTGSVIGAGSNVFGGIMPPTVVPPFSWGAGPDLRDHRLDKFLETADRVMERRDQVMTPGVRALLDTAWGATAGRRAV